MVSRRNFFYIFIMMAVLLFMFQFLQVFKENENRYDTNEYAENAVQAAGGRWQLSRMDIDDPGLKNGEFVLLLSEEKSCVSEVVKQWCVYTKRTLVIADKAETVLGEGMVRPELLLIDSGAMNFETDTELLTGLAEQGVSMVFCNLPEADILEKDERLLALLGIKTVKSPTVTVEGMYLFSGFLLGGELVLVPQTPEEEERLDINLEIPWYIMGKGTKTYMVGVMDEDEVERENFPAIIWRNSYENAMIFAICGDYMTNAAGLGILDSIVYELSPYILYPVVNANNVTVTGFPGFADENAGKIRELYSRSPGALMRDVMWPGISAMAGRFEMRFTFCMTPQYDYMDDIEPNGEMLVFYLQQMKQIGSEAGGMLTFREADSLNEKLERDSIFFETAGSSYQYCAWYIGKEVTSDAAEALGGEFGKEIRTLVCDYRDDCWPVSYYNENVTLQMGTGSVQKVTYSQELRKRSLETALGYSNAFLDMSNVIWPQSEEDHWENYFDVISSNMGTYWSDTGCFDKTVLSESDERIRSFLNLDYSTERTDENITLQVEGAGENAWFLLRTHGEDIREAQGAECVKVEEGVWLIKAFSGNVTLKMESAEEEL